MTDEAVWYRLECLVDDADRGSDQLWELGAAGVEVQDHETFMEGGAIAPVPEGSARLIAFFDLKEADPEGFEDDLRARLSCRSMRLDRFEDESWATAWKDYFRPVRMSRRSVVGPPWEELEAPDGGLAIVIEPGMAFGTGTHETTQVVGDILDELIGSEPPGSMLDVGCGSAILSMLARGLGVSRVVGVDVDATAVEIARENVELNGFDDIQLSTTPVDRIGEEFPLVVANILGHILLKIRDPLLATVAPGGRLVVSGVTTEQADAFDREFRGTGFVREGRRELGEWVAFIYTRES